MSYLSAALIYCTKSFRDYAENNFHLYNSNEKKKKSKTDQIFSLKNIFVNQRICSLNGEVPRRVLRMKHQKPS